MKNNKAHEKLKAVILCGGKGERLYPFTKDIPKPLVEIKDKPILSYIIQHLEKYDIKDRTNEQVYSIDSKETSDYDDAFSITELGNNAYKISIYISNVPLIIAPLI